MTLPASENEFDRRQINPIIGDDDVGHTATGQFTVYVN
jgi:hypothetical protein